MRTWLDHYAKCCLHDFLEPTGKVETQKSVASTDAQWIDVWCEPHPERTEERSHLGWLGKMAEKTSMFEPFSWLPNEDDVRGCLRKLLTKHHRRLLKHKKTTQMKPELPRCWIIAPALTVSMIEACGFQRCAPWPEGIYLMPSIVGVGWVSLEALPKNPETLSLRLLAGRGNIFEEALEEVERLPEGAWNKSMAQQIFLARYEEVVNHTEKDDEELAFMLTAKERYEQWEKRTLDAGMQRGLAEGIEKGIEKGREKGLRSALRALYQSRFGMLSAELAHALENEHNPDVLLSWVSVFSTETPERIAQVLGVTLSSSH